MTAAIQAAAAALRAGGTVLHPTEAVWGLACDPMNPDAVTALQALKQRPADKGFILVADTFQRLAALLAPVPEAQMQAALATWPGPHTWVIPAASTAPEWLVGERNNLAVRVSAHPIVRALCAAFDGALVSTSANPAGEPPPRTLDQVAAPIRIGVAAVVPGETSGLERPTTIRDILSGTSLRD